MKKIILFLIIFLLVGCSGQKYTGHEEVANYFIEEALSIEFEEYRNLTATSGNLKISMRDRYELFEPYLSKDYEDEFERRETFWYGIWEISGRQFEMVMENLQLELSLDDEKEKVYFFKADVMFDFVDSDDQIKREQEGELRLELNGNKWKVTQLKYTNDIFKDVVWP